jgi:endonuclease YncB( thermonuclease family)
MRVVDGETLILDGGSEVKLVGTLAPRSFDAAAAAPDDWAPAQRSREGLEHLVASRNVRIAFAGRRTDRYGRLLAHVFTGSEGSHLWVQGELLKRGLTRAYALEGSTHCLAELLGHEAVAREKATGLWAETAYAIRGADEVGGLLRLAGTFQIVEGRIHAVSELRGNLYINFGEDFRQDFTVTMRQQARRGLAEAGLVANELTGRRVRVRGWIERRGGPMIDVSHVSLIEVLAPEAEEAPAAAPPPSTRRRARQRAEPAQ